MGKLYDVYFTLATPAVIAVEADNQEDAEEKLFNISNSELMERILNAIDYDGVEVTNVEEIDNGVGKTREVAIAIMDMFDDMLEEKGIKVPDEDRTGEESEAALYGTTYYELENKIWELLCEYIDE